MTTQNTNCAFCRSRHISWTDHSIEKCHLLGKHQCTYCKELGHTNSRCPKSLLKKQKEEDWQKHEEEKRARWEANEKVRKEEKEKQVQFKANCWASIAAKSIPSEVAAKLAEEDRILKEQSEAKRAAEAVKRAEEEKVRKQAAKERWERNYVRRMRDQYGLKEDFVVPSHYGKSEICLSKGDFWYFHVEGSKTNDHEIAKKMREDITNQQYFRAYLKEKYFVNWLNASEDTEDDCLYLVELRYQKDREEEEAYYELLKWEEEQDKIWKKELEDEEREEEEMKAKLASGAITKKQYYEWEWAKQEKKWEDEDAYHADGLRLYEANYQHMRAEAEWKARKEARDKKK